VLGRNGQKAVWSVSLLGCSSGDVSKPEIVFLINGKPLGEETYYLGEKLTISFEAKSGSEHIKVDSFKWANVDPAPVIFSYDKIELSNGGAIIYPSQYFDNQPLALTLYNHLSVGNQQSWLLQYVIDGKSFDEEGQISFQSPTIGDVQISQSIPSVFQSSYNASYPVLGFPGFGEKGVKFWAWGENKTDIVFDIGAVQLLRYFDSYVHQDGTTMNVDMADFRLDRSFPYGKPKQISQDLPWEKKDIFFDGPETPIDWANANSELYRANTKFKVFIVCKPNIPNSEWVPVTPYLYEWRWQADAKKENKFWSLVEGSYFPSEDILLQDPVKTKLCNLLSDFTAGFPKWSKCYKGENLQWKETP